MQQLVQYSTGFELFQIAGRSVSDVAMSQCDDDDEKW